MVLFIRYSFIHKPIFMKHYIILLLLSFLSVACILNGVDTSGAVKGDLHHQLEVLNSRLVNAALNKDFKLISDLYLDSSLLLAEYQPMLDGKDQIRAFYKETYERQNLADYKRQTIEIFDFDALVLEIGLFEKTLTDGSSLRGKYFTTWKKGKSGQLLLRAEGFGFIGEPANPDRFRIMPLTDDKEPLKGKVGKAIPMEIQAYHALGENMVRDRDTQGTVEAYTKDAIYYPFADSAKTGYTGLLKHFTAYHKNPVKIDSIETWTYDYDLVDNGFIRYSKFFVIWTLTNGYTGTSSGTGMTYTKRTEGNALKSHRKLATHTYRP